jgi:hypothetical protein
MNAQPERRRPHRKTVLALVVVAAVLAFLAIFALWANRQLLNTDNWTDTSTQLLENDEIREQTADYLVDQLYANVDVTARLEQALPPRADGLAGPAASGLRDLATRVTRGLLERPRVQQLWEEANRRAHARFLNIVEGGGPVVSTEEGDVTLDLKELLGQTESRVGIGGRAESKLPADAAQLTIVRSDQLDFAQDLVDLLKALEIVLVVLSLALFALAVYLARGWRRQALRATGIGFLAAGVAALVARTVAGGAVVDALASTEAIRPAAEATWGIGTSLLTQAAVAAIAYGVVIVAAAWLAGPTGSAIATRRALAPYLREPAYAYGALGVIVAVIVWWGPTPATRQALPLFVLIGLLVLGLEVLRRQTAREFPEATREGAAQRRRELWSGWTSSLRGRDAREATTRTADQGGARLEELERLTRLRDARALAPEEFEREKRRILEGPAVGPPTPA